MGDLKLEHIRAVSPDVLVSGDMSCLMHMGGLAEKEGKPIRTLPCRRLPMRPKSIRCSASCSRKDMLHEPPGRSQGEYRSA